jgi:hypothetical protein
MDNDKNKIFDPQAPLCQSGPVIWHAGKFRSKTGRKKNNLEWYEISPTNLEVEIIGMKGMTVNGNNCHSIVKLQ